MNNLEQIDITKTNSYYTNESIFKTLKYYTNYDSIIYDDDGNEIDNLVRVKYFSEILQHITNKDLLNHTINYLKVFGFLEFANVDFENFKNEFIHPYSDFELTRIKAIMYSLTSKYEIYKKILVSPKCTKDFPLNIKLKNNIIEHNLPEILKAIKKDTTLNFVNDIKELNKNEQNEKISLWINSLNSIKYSQDTDYFNQEIDFLERSKNNLIENKEFQQINDFNFTNNFDKVDEIIIFKYFKNNLVDRKHISETVLNEFLNLAFDKKTLPKQKFSFEKLNTQKDIVNIFYNYYKTTAGKPYGKQKDYLNLLCNYFIGFENFNLKNFSK